MTNGIVSPATGTSEDNSTPGQPILLAGRGRPLPPGYIHLGVSKEIAPTLREFGVEPDPVIREAGLDPHLFDDGTNVIPLSLIHI